MEIFAWVVIALDLVMQLIGPVGEALKATQSGQAAAVVVEAPQSEWESVGWEA